MKNPIVPFKTSNDPFTSRKKSWAEISTFTEISTHFVSDSIIEYQIFCFISPILHANLGKKVAKCISQISLQNAVNIHNSAFTFR